MYLTYVVPYMLTCFPPEEPWSRGLTDEFERQVFVGSRLLGVFVEEHDRAADPAVFQSLLAHAGQLRTEQSRVRVQPTGSYPRCPRST